MIKRNLKNIVSVIMLLFVLFIGLGVKNQSYADDGTISIKYARSENAGWWYDNCSYLGNIEGPIYIKVTYTDSNINGIKIIQEGYEPGNSFWIEYSNGMEEVISNSSEKIFKATRNGDFKVYINYGDIYGYRYGGYGYINNIKYSQNNEPEVYIQYSKDKTNWEYEAHSLGNDLELPIYLKVVHKGINRYTFEATNLSTDAVGPDSFILRIEKDGDYRIAITDTSNNIHYIYAFFGNRLVKTSVKTTPKEGNSYSYLKLKVKDGVKPKIGVDCFTDRVVIMAQNVQLQADDDNYDIYLRSDSIDHETVNSETLVITADEFKANPVTTVNIPLGEIEYRRKGTAPAIGSVMAELPTYIKELENSYKHSISVKYSTDKINWKSSCSDLGSAVEQVYVKLTANPGKGITNVITLKQNNVELTGEEISTNEKIYKISDNGTYNVYSDNNWGKSDSETITVDNIFNEPTTLKLDIVGYSISKNGTYYSSQDDVLKTISDTDTLSGIYVKVKATSNINITSIKRKTESNIIMSEIEEEKPTRTAIFYINKNGDYEIEAIAGKETSAKTGSTKISINSLNSSLSFTVEYGLDEYGNYYSTENAALRELDRAYTLDTIYIKVTAKSNVNITSIWSDDEDIEIDSEGEEGTERIAIFHTSENKTYKIKAKAGGREGEKNVPVEKIDSYGTSIGYVDDTTSITVADPDSISGTVTNSNEILLTNISLQNVNWDIKENIDWNRKTEEMEKLTYKTISTTKSTNPIKEEFNNSVAMDIGDTIHEKALGNPYIVAVYSNDGNIVAGEKECYNGTSNVTIDGTTKVNGYMEVVEVPITGATSKNVQLQKKEGDVTVKDLPYTVSSNISISCTGSGENTKVTITPSDSIKDIKEVGVIVEYTSDNLKKGVVKKTNTITGSEITFDLKHIPTGAMYTAYCITNDNEEIWSR